MHPCMTEELDPTKLSLEEMNTMVNLKFLLPYTYMKRERERFFFLKVHLCLHLVNYDTYERLCANWGLILQKQEIP